MNDVRFALRQLLKNPAFTAVAVLTLPKEPSKERRKGSVPKIRICDVPPKCLTMA